MKKENLRYTEHRFKFTPTTSEGWVKLVLLHVIVGPIRLVNEISQKFVFLGSRVSKRILSTSIVIDILLLLWNVLLWPLIAGPQKKMFISLPALLVSLGSLSLMYYFLSSQIEFSFNVLDEVDEEEEEALLAFDAESFVAFAEVKSAEISFAESINIFIKDPVELEVHNIPASVYQAAEDNRLVEALSKSGSFVTSTISIPDLLSGPPIGSQIRDNFDAMHLNLSKQLDVRDKMLDDALLLELE